MLDTMFATETRAELSARQGRVADAVAIYRHLLNDAAPGELTDKWKRRLAELEAGPTSATALPDVVSPAPPSAAPPIPDARERVEVPATSAGPRPSLVIR